MRVLSVLLLFLAAPVFLLGQEGCTLFNLQELAAENLALQDSLAGFSGGEVAVDTVILQTDGSLNVELSNGVVYTIVQGCTDPLYTEYAPEANTDDGSCATIEGCTDAAYVEYDPAANSDDGSCSNLLGCTDSDMVSMDGEDYEVVTIGAQCWFAENLRTTVYSNGDLIPTGSTVEELYSTSEGRMMVFGVGDLLCQTPLSPGFDVCDETLSLEAYGRLYNGHAVSNAAGLCPTGWHVPTNQEWTDLENHIVAEGFSAVADRLKTTSGWGTNRNGTDDVGFSALPGGYFYNAFYNAGFSGSWWSSTDLTGLGEVAWGRSLGDDMHLIHDTAELFNGRSVRCLRDAD